MDARCSRRREHFIELILKERVGAYTTVIVAAAGRRIAPYRDRPASELRVGHVAVACNICLVQLCVVVA